MSKKETLDFNAEMTLEEVEKGELNYKEQERNIGVSRRACLAILTKTKQEITTACEDEPEAFMDLIEASGTSINYLKNVVDLMESGHARMLYVMDELYGDCKTEVQL